MRDQMAERHTSAIGDGLKNERLKLKMNI